MLQAIRKGRVPARGPLHCIAHISQAQTGGKSARTYRANNYNKRKRPPVQAETAGQLQTSCAIKATNIEAKQAPIGGQHRSAADEADRSLGLLHLLWLLGAAPHPP